MHASVRIEYPNFSCQATFYIQDLRHNCISACFCLRKLYGLCTAAWVWFRLKADCPVTKYQVYLSSLGQRWTDLKKQKITRHLTWIKFNKQFRPWWKRTHTNSHVKPQEKKNTWCNIFKARANDGSAIFLCRSCLNLSPAWKKALSELSQQLSGALWFVDADLWLNSLVRSKVHAKQ